MFITVYSTQNIKPFESSMDIFNTFEDNFKLLETKTQFMITDLINPLICPVKSKLKQEKITNFDNIHENQDYLKRYQSYLDKLTFMYTLNKKDIFDSITKEINESDDKNIEELKNFSSNSNVQKPVYFQKLFSFLEKLLNRENNCFKKQFYIFIKNVYEKKIPIFFGRHVDVLLKYISDAYITYRLEEQNNISKNNTDAKYLKQIDDLKGQINGLKTDLNTAKQQPKENKLGFFLFFIAGIICTLVVFYGIKLFINKEDDSTKKEFINENNKDINLEIEKS